MQVPVLPPFIPISYPTGLQWSPKGEEVPLRPSLNLGKIIGWNLTFGYLTSPATICSYTQISSSREQVAVDSVAVVQVPPNHQLHHHYFRHHHTITIIWVTIIYLLHHSPRTVIMFTKSSSPGKYRDQTWPAVGCWSQDFCSSNWACHHFQKVVNSLI